MARESKADKMRRLSIPGQVAATGFNGAFRLLVEHWQGGPGEVRNDRELTIAARHLAGAITAYAETKRQGFPLRRDGHEDIHSFREEKAADLAKRAKGMLGILDAPASRGLFLPEIEDPLRKALLALVEAHSRRPPPGEARRRREAARTSLEVRMQQHKGTLKHEGADLRAQVRNAIINAWRVATDKEVERRKSNVEQEPYGEFYEFLKAALDLTGETNDMNADVVWREIMEDLDNLRAGDEVHREHQPYAVTPVDEGEFARVLDGLAIPYELDRGEGIEHYKLAHCPFDPAHNGAVILRRPVVGRFVLRRRPVGPFFAFVCTHNACRGKTWRDVRALVGGDGPNGG